MPIYAYKCDACGFAKDVLQKVSDAPLEVCPSCSQSAFRKQLTAAGFQLKGSGWYVTDFRGGSSAAAGKEPEAGAATEAPKPAATDTAAASATSATPANSATTAPASSSST